MLAGQKSGVVYGLDPDHGGEILWQTQVRRRRCGSRERCRAHERGRAARRRGHAGGVGWGGSADHRNFYAALSGLAGAARQCGGSLTALDLKTGVVRWSTPAPQPACAGAAIAGMRRRKRSRSCRASHSQDRWTATCAPTRPSTARFSGISTLRKHFKPERRSRQRRRVGSRRGDRRERQRLHQLGQCPPGLLRRSKIGRNKYPWHDQSALFFLGWPWRSSARRRPPPRVRASPPNRRRWKTRW